MNTSPTMSVARIASAVASLAFVLFAFIPSSKPTHACSCGSVGSHPADSDPAPGFDAVCIATLTDEQPDFIPDVPTLRTLRFTVQTSWKGITGTDLPAVTEAGGSFAGCGFYGAIGTTYLLYGNRRPDGQLQLGLCSHLEPEYELAKQYLYELQALNHKPIRLTMGLDPLRPPSQPAAPEQVEETSSVDDQPQSPIAPVAQPGPCGLGVQLSSALLLLTFATLRLHSYKRKT